MRVQGDPRGGDDAISLPSGFKYIIGVAALFIAGCSAFFSVKGLGLLFIGSATAVMIMAASLEVGKLVAASFLYRYWRDISGALRVYLLIAVVILIGITSLGNYGYLARAYERTHTQVTALEDQIVMLEKENADTQHQIDAARGQLNKATDSGRESLASLQVRITTANTSLDQALTRIQEKRTGAQATRDRDLQTGAQQLASRNDSVTKALATEDTVIAGLNDQLAVLDRAVDAYTKQGGPGFFKADSIKKGQELREQQTTQRETLAAQITQHRDRQETLRAELDKNISAADKETATIRQQFDTGWAALDAEEKQLRQSQLDGTAQIEQQVAALQTLGLTTTSTSSTAIESLYQRIRSNNDQIQHRREQVAGTDIGSYRFVARAFDAQADSIVKWLTLALVIVFDPLAVCLAVGFNVALIRDRRHRPSPLMAPTGEGSAVTGNGVSRSRLTNVGLSIVLLTFGTGGIAVGAYYGVNALRQASQSKHATLVPGNSFAVITLRPAQWRNPDLLASHLGAVPGRVLTDALGELLKSGFDPQADVYAFAKFPNKKSATDRPVMLAGLVARVNDPAAAEAALARMADQISTALRPENSPSTARGRAMIRFGRGRYLDPEGGFFTFGLANDSAVLLVELEGDAAAPIVETEMQACLATARPATADKLPERALVRSGVASVWLDAARFFTGLPKNSAAQLRHQQLQRYVDFNLVLTLQPTTDNQISIAADYTYQSDRFKDRLQPTALQVLANLGAVDATGLGGQLLDRCADTLDYDSLIERLRTTLSTSAPTGVSEVLVEKSFVSDREAQFTVNVRQSPATGTALALP